MTTDYQARMEKLLATVDADVVALVPGENLQYFTGLRYHRSERPLIAFIAARGLSVIIPSLEVLPLNQRSDLNAQKFVWHDENGYAEAFKQAVSSLQGKRLGVDGQTMRVFEWFALGDAGYDLGQRRDVGADLLRIRATKSESELDALRAAIRLSETALRRTMQQVQVGMSELQIAALLSDALAKEGSEGRAFGPAVQRGDHSAAPHSHPGELTLRENDLLLIDFGGIKHSYPADITRTFVFGDGGEHRDELRKMYDAVYRANEAARAVARPGIPCGEIDKAARDAITAAGYGEYFTHRTGHGLGLAVHELPQIASGVAMLLEPGMVFTVEPGVYIEGIGGVRIEDDVVITADGVETMTSYTREWGELY